MESSFHYNSSFKPQFKIGDYFIGQESPCFIVAEAGVSNFGSLEKAFQLVDSALNARADAVKFQFFNTEELISADCPEWIERMKPKEMPISFIKKISEYCKKKGILFFSTAHDLKSLYELAEMDMHCFKIGSGELQNPEFYRIAASFNKPLIISTGMFLEEDILQVLNILSASKNPEVAVMHCITNYPVPPKDANLKMIQSLKSIFPGPVGYSDHSATFDIPAASVLLGANIIEKHITLEKNVANAQDWKVSCTPDEFVEFVASIRRIEDALGDGEFRLTEGERKSIQWARKSIVAARDLSRNDIIKKEDVLFKRPGTGISPSKVEAVLGKRAKTFIKRDSVISEGTIF